MEGRERDRFEEFLARQDRVRELARRLLGDEAEVEDVVQDTYVAYLSKSAEEIRNLSTWLHSVVSNLCRRVIRQRVQENRTVRGDGNGMESPMPTPDQVAQMESTRHRVLEEVFRLPEAYGTVVWLRYFQGLEPYEIAQRLNILGATVRSRQNRGVELLRQRLARDEEAQESLLPGLLLLAGGRPQAVPVPPAPSELPAPVGAASGWSASVGLGAAVLVAGGLLVVASGPIASESTGPSVGGYRLADVEALAAAPAAADRRPVGPSSARGAQALPQGDWVVRGRLVLGQDPFRPERPIEEGHVLLSLFEGTEASGDPLLEVELDCDERGRFRFALPDPGRTVTVRLRTDMDGYFARAEERVVGRGARLSHEIELPVFAVNTTISGRVVDAAGRPVGRAYVHGSGDAVLTAFDGTFRLPASRQAEIWLEAWAEGHGYGRRQVDLANGARPDGVEVRLSTEAVARGRVEDERGLPVAGARLVSFACSRYVRAETDANGTFELAGLDRDRKLELYTVYAPGYAPRNGVLARGDTAPATIRLERGATLAGTVVDVDGRPLAGAVLSLRREQGDTGGTKTFSDDDGRFTLENLSLDEGRGTLVVEHGDRFVCTAVLALDDPAPAPLHLRADPTTTLAGHVVDAEGRPVAGAFVGVQVGDRWRATTDRPTGADGGFLLRDVPLGASLHLAVLLRGVRQDVHTLSALDAAALEVPLVLRVGGPSGLALRVVDGSSGASLSAFEVRLEPAVVPGALQLGALDGSWTIGVPAAPDAQGIWRSPADLALPAGSAVDVIVRAPGFAPRRVEGVLVPPPFDGGVLSVHLSPGLELRGRVMTPQGRPAAGARVARRTVDGGWQVVGSTGPDGAFALAEAASEPVVVALLHADGAVVTGPLDPAFGEHRVVLAGGGRLRVEPTGAGHAFVRGAAGPVEGLRRDAASAEPLPAGDYDVVHRVRDLERLVLRVRVDADVERRVTLRSDGDATLDVSVLGRSVPPGLSARLERLDPAGDLDVVALGEPVVDGHARLERVPAGRWRLVVTGEARGGGVPPAGSLELALAPGEHGSVAVSLATPPR